MLGMLRFAQQGGSHNLTTTLEESTLNFIAGSNLASVIGLLAIIAGGLFSTKWVTTYISDHSHAPEAVKLFCIDTHVAGRVLR